MLLSLAPALVSAAPLRIYELHLMPDRMPRLFRPADAFGVAIDGGNAAETTALFDPTNAAAIRGARLRNASYRLRTELAGQVWHWSSYGRWSDQDHHQGYWVGDPSRDDNHELSFGFRLPRRGNSRDEAEDDGFSRVDDGDPTSFWKSNPYLDPKLDGTGIERQWVILDLGRTRQIDTAQVHWAEPYAAQFRLQRWVGDDQYYGKWTDLTPSLQGHAGLQAVTFTPANARFVRILLERSSHVAAGKDRRDAMGYGIAELELGIRSPTGFRDYVQHAASGHKQTQVTVSSTDPWHREGDRDTDSAQPSLVALHERGLFAGPFLLPLPLLTDTPENAVAELRYFRRRGVPIKALELGEEPEGQLAPPRMVAALYSRLASLIAQEAPGIAIGGPSLIDPIADTTLDDDDESWTQGFLGSLRRSARSSPIQFLSTELYPVENLCESSAHMLQEVARAPKRMAARFREDGAADLPWMVTEYGLSPYGGKALRGTVAALADAEILARSLSQGVADLYLYGTSPASAVPGKQACAGRGNLTLWNSDRLGHILSGSIRLRVFEAVRDQWSNPNDAQEELIAVGGAPRGVEACALRREDGSLSLLLINRTERRVRLRLGPFGPTPKQGAAAIVDRVDFATSQAATRPHESRTLPAEVELAPESLAILRLDQAS